MQRKFELYLKDIIEEIDIIQDFTCEYNFEDFNKDKKTIYAVTRALEIIGEAASNIPEEIRENNPEVPWQEIKKFRNVIVHKYWGVETDVEWNIIKDKLAILKSQISSIINNEEF